MTVCLVTDDDDFYYLFCSLSPWQRFPSVAGGLCVRRSLETTGASVSSSVHALRLTIVGTRSLRWL